MYIITRQNLHMFARNSFIFKNRLLNFNFQSNIFNILACKVTDEALLSINKVVVKIFHSHSC